jgi:hypothetical protein
MILLSGVGRTVEYDTTLRRPGERWLGIDRESAGGVLEAATRSFMGGEQSELF